LQTQYGGTLTKIFRLHHGGDVTLKGFPNYPQRVGHELKLEGK